MLVTDENISDVVEAARGVLIITKSGCGSCKRYEREIVSARDAGKLEGVVVGKIVLDEPGSPRFKKNNPWLRDLTRLPFTLIYANGDKLDGFAASKANYLTERLGRLPLAAVMPSDLREAATS